VCRPRAKQRREPGYSRTIAGGLGFVHFDCKAFLGTETSGIFGRSTVNVDPTLGVAGSNSLGSEPSSLIMGLIGLATAGDTIVLKSRRRS